MEEKYLIFSEKDNALRIRCPETDKIHASWLLKGSGLMLSDSTDLIVIFEDIPENYPSTALLIEPYTIERVIDIVENIIGNWGCDDIRLPNKDSEYGKDLRRSIKANSDLAEQLCMLIDS